MKVVGLVSGGKDSCYAMMKCIEYGHEIVALANLLPLDDSVDELNSYMYQTVGHQIVVSYAECMGLPLFRRRIHGSTRHQSLNYRTTFGDEVEDMLILLSEVKRQIPSITAVSSGAIASDYQRLRVESVCSSLGLVSLAYLWKQDQSLLLQEMISNGVAAIFVKVAAMGLDPQKHLGKDIGYLQDHLLRLKELYGSNVCGEGGEYETLTLDCPLFTNARIALDGFEVLLHSPGCIAPVGVLHPTAFHLEYKKPNSSISNNKLNDVGNRSIFEVKGDFVDAKCKSKDVSELISVADVELHISKTSRNDTFSLCCWIHDPCENSQGLQQDLTSILKRIESELIKDGFGWMNVLYVHLYIADMNEFALANETYVSFITVEDCQLGVPSRSTIELPLSKVGLGKAYIEVLVANDKSKQVLHVQSISCWAPSCIGPYSQATLHKEILYMAGQLGLDPPVMKLCCGGPTAEVEKALENCQAVAENFKCCIESSTILFVVYCSASLSCSQRIQMQQKLEVFLEQRKRSYRNSSTSKLPDPMFLYVLAPDLPKSALVEIKPTLYVQEDEEIELDTDLRNSTPTTSPSYHLPPHWAFEHVRSIDYCCKKYVVHEKICAVTASITNEIATKICMESLGDVQNHEQSSCLGTQKQMEQITRYCIYLLDNILSENSFSWGDITSLRFYFLASLKMSQDMMSLIFTNAFNEFAEISQRLKVGTNHIFNLVPVLGSGQSAACMDDLITCELFASKL